MLDMRLHGGDFPGTPARPAEQRMAIRAEENRSTDTTNSPTTDQGDRPRRTRLVSFTRATTRGTAMTVFESNLNGLRESLNGVKSAIERMQREGIPHGADTRVRQILLDHLPGNGNPETEAFANHLATTIMKPGPLPNPRP